jgi:hypothetical protein
MDLLSRAKKKNGRQNHGLTQWKMLHHHVVRHELINIFYILLT